MWLLLGLGNIGNKYAKTRHNIGFDIVSALALRLEVSFKLEQKFQSEVVIYKNTFILAKPQTFMNASGCAAIALVDFYKPKGVLVIHDELDLNFGDIKFKFGGSSGGHNGLKSIENVISQNFYRLRFGIGKIDELKLQENDSSKEQKSIISHVLSRFSADTSDLINHCVNALLDFVSFQDFTRLQNKFTLKAKGVKNLDLISLGS